MTRPMALIPVVIMTLLTACKAIAAQPTVERPNIVFIMADDMGRDWTSAYGAAHRTPNVDRLAAQGVRFDNVWCAPICTPTRAQLLTGRYPFRTGWIDHHDVPRWGGKGLDWEREVTFARLVRRAGYATAIGGKWQINDFRAFPDALTKHGFDEHCVWTGYETGNPPSGERYWDAYLQTNGNRQTHTGKYGPDLVCDFLVDFIRRHKDRPFLVYYPLMLPHGPFIPTPLNRDDPPVDKRSLYAGMVTYVDRLVGRITKTIDDLGLAERTVLIFTCDNGSPLRGGSINGRTYPAGKGRTNDWGVHMPFIVRAPGLTRGPRTSDRLIDFTDMLPTFVELAGGRLPKGVTLDGRSFAHAIRSAAKAPNEREWIYAQRGRNRTVRDKRFKLDSSGAFWDLLDDPLEERDQRDSTNADHVTARQRLSRVLAAMPANAPPPFEPFGRTRPRANRAR